MKKEIVQQVRIDRHGDPSVLELKTVAIAPPAHGEVQIRQQAIGVNFVDVYHRTGLFPVPALPAVLGVEGVGIVEHVGPGVSGIEVGQRVAYAGPPIGSYATARNLSAERAVVLPDAVSIESAAGSMLRGITAHMLYSHVRKLHAGEVVLIHAAAGGLGLLLTQLAKAAGATVIGTVGSEEKAKMALAHGADHVIQYRETDFVSVVHDLTSGRGVDYAIDGIGGDTLNRTLDAVRPFGMIASIGQVAGDVGVVGLGDLGPRRSITLSRPGVFRYMADLACYREGAEATLARLAEGLRVQIAAELPISEAATAHRLLESGKSIGSVILRP
ncbi:MAG TPA: quinone oxidoreductase [Noviherbaspirillum sp.]|nr:quinone oxidoreductase [Noviherbaspirillum sp.]